MQQQKIAGIFNILATPFDAQQRLDLESLRHLVEFQLDKGAHGLTILGILGEAAKLSVDERKQVMDTVMETVNGQVPVVVGTSHPERATCIALSQVAFEAGASGVMIAPPPMEPPTDDKVLALYDEIGSAVNNTIVVQDFPAANNVYLSPDLLATLAEQNPHTRHLKMEDPPLMEKVSAILDRTDKLAVFGGLGGMFLLEELRRGVAGTMTGFAFTEILIAVFDAYQEGRMSDAERIFDHYLPLIRFENQAKINLTIRKELLYRRNAMAHATPRDPYTPVRKQTHDEIDWIFKRVGISDPTQKLSF